MFGVRGNKINQGGNKLQVVSQPKIPNQMSFNERKADLDDQKKKEEEELKRRKKSPFSDFYQVNRRHSNDMQWLLSESPKAFQILLFLLDHMDKYNAVMCSYTVFQEALGMGRTTASTAVKLLKDHGFIAIVKSGTSNVYIVNNDLAWSSWGTNVQYCEFPANIIISSTEQEERTKFKKQRITTVIKKEGNNNAN